LDGNELFMINIMLHFNEYHLILF